MHEEDRVEEQALAEVVELRQRLASLEERLRLLEEVEAELVQTAAALRESRETYRLLVEEVGDVVYMVDRNRFVTYISPVIEGVSGYRPSEIVGRSFLDFVHGEDVSRVDEQFQENISGRLPLAQFKFRVLTKAGEVRWARTYSRPIFVENRVVGLRGVMTDVSEQVQLAQEQERLIHELQDALARAETLRGLLHICSSCKKVRDSEGQWVPIEEYVRRHSQARFTHDLCPECARLLYPGVFQEKDES